MPVTTFLVLASSIIAQQNAAAVLFDPVLFLVCSPDATYDDLLTTSQPFAQPIPLPVGQSSNALWMSNSQQGLMLIT
jgi:hypothetical protein